MRKITYKILTKITSKFISNGLILIIALFIYGIIGSYFIMGLNLVDSTYYAIITMSTVGYGDYTPLTTIQKIFATTLAISGVALLAYIFNIMLSNFQKKMSEYSKGVKKMKAIELMEDYYIICGYGRVGKVVFNELIDRNQNVIVIDKDKDKCDSIKEEDNIVVINEDAIENNLIAKLAKDKCRSVIICTGNDVNNLFMVLTIRETNPNAWIVSRASKIDNIARLKKAGANKIVSPEIIGGEGLYNESAKPHILRITVKHSSDEIFDEFKIIAKYGCTLENIEYHLPGIETPLRRKIKTRSLEDGKDFIKSLNSNDNEKQALENLYEITNNIHSHLISGPNKATLNKLLKNLEKVDDIIGVNLTNKEIAKITSKEIK